MITVLYGGLPVSKHGEMVALKPPFSPGDLTLIRESFGMNKSEFARMLRVHRNTWGKLESGERSLDQLQTNGLQYLLLLRQHAPKILLDWMEESS